MLSLSDQWIVKSPESDCILQVIVSFVVLILNSVAFPASSTVIGNFGHGNKDKISLDGGNFGVEYGSVWPVTVALKLRGFDVGVECCTRTISGVNIVILMVFPSLFEKTSWFVEVWAGDLSLNPRGNDRDIFLGFNAIKTYTG